MSKSQLCWRLLRANWRIFLALVLAQSCVLTLAPLALGTLLRIFFDDLAGARPEISRLLILALLMLGLAFGRMLLFLAVTWLQVTTEYAVLGALWHSVLENFLRGFGAQAPRASPGEVLNRLREDGMALAKFASGAAQCAGVLGGSLGAMAIMVHTSAAVAVAAVVPMLLSTVVTIGLKPTLHRAAQEQRAATARVTSLMGDIISGIESIQCASAEQRYTREFARRNLRRGAAMVRDQVVLAASRTAGAAAQILGMSGMLLIGTQQLRSGSFSLGDLAFFAHMLSYVAASFEFLSDTLASYGRLDVATGRLEELIAGSGGGSSLGEAPHPPRLSSQLRRARSAVASVRGGHLRSLSAAGLSFSFSRDGRAGIRDVSFDLMPGTLTVVTGPAGAGKSTLLRCVVGQLPLHGGQLLWNRKPIQAPREFFQPPLCAVCPQVPHVFDASVRANIELGARLSESELQGALRTSVLDQDLAIQQLALDTRVGHRGRQLSGGQLQRLGAARMFARRAELYVFDDVTRSLDPATELLFWSRLSERLQQGAAALCVSHCSTALELAATVLVMAEGRLIAKGKLSQLVSENPRLMAEVQRSQN